jgi:hypothetical protein
MISEKQKFAIDYAISLNPTSLVVERVEYLEHEGARKKKETTTQTQTWLVYPKTNKTKFRREDAGSEDESDWGALAPSSADVKWGANVTDTVEIDNIGTLEVKSGRPIMVGTDLNGYQLDLKLVK